MKCASLQFFCPCNKTLIYHYNGIVRPDCTQQNEVVFHQMILFVGTTNWLFPWFDNYLGLNDENWLLNIKCIRIQKPIWQKRSLYLSHQPDLQSIGIGSVRRIPIVWIRFALDLGLICSCNTLSLCLYSWGLARQSTKQIETLSHSTRNIICLFLLHLLNVWCLCLVRVCPSPCQG